MRAGPSRPAAPGKAPGAPAATSGAIYIFSCFIPCSGAQALLQSHWYRQPELNVEESP
jgi:hypothetical protein